MVFSLIRSLMEAKGKAPLFYKTIDVKSNLLNESETKGYICILHNVFPDFLKFILEFNFMSLYFICVYNCLSCVWAAKSWDGMRMPGPPYIFHQSPTLVSQLITALDSDSSSLSFRGHYKWSGEIWKLLFMHEVKFVWGVKKTPLNIF